MLREHNFCIVGYASNSFKNTIFSNLKDLTPKENQSSVVYDYEVTCECGGQYIGITKQYLASRFKQHIYDAKCKTKNPNQTKKVSAISTHLAVKNHKITFDDLTTVNGIFWKCYTLKDATIH